MVKKLNIFFILFLISFLTSCLDEDVFHVQDDEKPFTVSVSDKYQDPRGDDLKGVIPINATSKISIEYNVNSNQSKNSIVFYYLILTGEQVYNPPFNDFETFRLIAKSFVFEKGESNYEILLKNKLQNNTILDTTRKTLNDKIGTVYAIYVIPDDDQYLKSYNFNTPIPDAYGPKSVGELNIPNWLVRTGKWLNEDDNNLFMKFVDNGSKDSLILKQDTGVLGIMQFDYMDKGLSPNYATLPMNDISGGGGVSEYGILNDRSGVYAKLELIHTKHIGVGSYIKFILKKNSNKMKIIGYNSFLKKTYTGFMVNENKKFNWKDVYPTRYRNFK